ncbi:MAG: DUF2304 domain-containing protein [Nitrospinae bacterium]|nr:DUF2304 domain-containing protein [Nitrospinota bacterium]
MTTTLRIVSVAFSSGFLLLIFELVRRKKLRENYSLTWFFVGVSVLVFSLFADKMDFFAKTLGFALVSNAILVYSIFLILVILLGLSVAVSRISSQTQKLVQEIGILKNAVEKADKNAKNTGK